MTRFFVGVGIGIFADQLLEMMIPIRVSILVCLACAGLAVLLFILFHLGVRDFQE